MFKLVSLALTMLLASSAFSQDATLMVKTMDGQKPLSNTTVELLHPSDSSLLKIQMTDSSGNARFDGLTSAPFLLRVSRIGFEKELHHITAPTTLSLNLKAVAGNLAGVTVTARKPFIELQAGKTVVNMESSISSAGATLFEALEKLPGVSIDKDGNISMKGRAGVTVFMDGKPVYLSGAELATMLQGINAGTVSQIELMDQPPARFDAAGNAGIINIRMKKNIQRGFNGNASVAYTQGVYPKFNGSTQFNYRSGNWNFFLNYSANVFRNFMRVKAYRTYFKPDGSVQTHLDQPSYTTMDGYTHNLRAGADYTISSRTSIGLTLGGFSLRRENNADNNAVWMDAQNHVDSMIQTGSRIKPSWENKTAALSLRHSFEQGRELTADLDMLDYRINTDQFFSNQRITAPVYTELSRANIPAHIRIYSAKTDYSQNIGQWKLESGLKISKVNTDNRAVYEYQDPSGWQPDLGKSNHFIYEEEIQAAYASTQTKFGKLSVQGGLRYERTAYDAHQLGNALVKDSAFSVSYNSLFPTLFFSLDADSSNTFTISAGRRIDRPAFQKLNPFIFVINKYTYQKGNPFFKPQYTWNVEVSHSYKNALITSLSYSVTTDYFSQIFPVDSGDIIIYTEGNLGKLQVFGLSVSTQLSPTPWWNLSAQTVVSHRRMEGVIGTAINANITQLNFSMNNQFRFRKGWGAEVSGFYTSRGRNDIQEIVDPAGQLSIGVSKTVLNQKGTIRLSGRDLFYTQWMKGNTFFQGAHEYFKLTRDTRVVTLSFTYRFGKAFKAVKRSSGASTEEAQRVGNG